MKKTTLFLLLLALACLLTACGCKHEWKEAACETPKTCTLCEETEGEPLGHSWQEATCEAPKTCSTCSLTEGEALGHSWVDATCEVPKTCTVCSSTDGNPLGHSFGEWTCTGEHFLYPCTVCGKDTTLSPEEFFRGLIIGKWKAVPFLSEDKNESITIHEDGTVDMDLESRLYCPDTLRLTIKELVYLEDSNVWRMDFYLEDHLAQEEWKKLNEEVGLYLRVSVREDKQELGHVAILSYLGYMRHWILDKY